MLYNTKIFHYYDNYCSLCVRFFIIIPSTHTPQHTHTQLQEVRTIVQSGLVVHSVQLFNSPGVDGRSVAISNLVDITRESNKELAMRLHTSVENTQDTFYTDNNGFQLVKRRTYTKLTIQGNFYPMPTCALVQDNNHRVTLFSGQPLGVASLKQGKQNIHSVH